MPGEGIKSLRHSPGSNPSWLPTGSDFPPLAPVLRQTGDSLRDVPEPAALASDPSALAELEALRSLHIPYDSQSSKFCRGVSFRTTPADGLLFAGTNTDDSLWASQPVEMGDSMSDWLSAVDLSGFPFPDLKLFGSKVLKPTGGMENLESVNDDCLDPWQLFNVMGRDMMV